MEGFAFEFDSQSKSFRRRDFSVPETLSPGEVLIRITCCTICGSDLHTFRGRRNAPANCVLGHEIIGTIEAWDGDAPVDYAGHKLALGQRVTWSMAVGCGDCFYCNHQLTQKCEQLFKYGHQSSASKVPTGGLSRYCMLVPGTPIFRLPDSISDEVACPANCATATVSAALRLISETHSIKGSTVLIVGAGMLGLTAAAQLCDSGARRILISDLDSSRLELAKSFGATHCIKASSPESLSEIATATNGRGVDIALDFAGMLSAVEFVLKSIRVGGCAVLAGSVFPMDALSISPEKIVRNMVTIRGIHNYGARDLQHALKFLERTHTRFPFQQLVSIRFPLHQVEQAFDWANSHRPIRVAINQGG